LRKFTTICLRPRGYGGFWDRFWGILLCILTFSFRCIHLYVDVYVVYLAVGEVYFAVGGVSLAVGEVYLAVGEVYLAVGEVYLAVGEVSLVAT
jgi:hypothetical protein